MNRDKMIEVLTKNELSMLCENTYMLDDIAEFFSNGGFNKYDDVALEKLYHLIFESV